jgi:phosphate transport system substrate-binding protein
MEEKTVRASIIKILLVFLLTTTLLLVTCSDRDTLPVDTSDPRQTPTEPPPYNNSETREDFTFTRDNFPRMDGSTSTAPLAEAVATVLLGEPRDAVAHLAADFSRTTQSFRNLANGLCDILIVSEPAPEVFIELQEMGFEPMLAPIALDALVFVVNADNPVSSLTHQQIQQIYTDRISNWSQVGGNDVEIVPFQRNAEAGSQVLMDKLVMSGQQLTDAPTERFMTAFGMGEMVTAMRGFDGSASAIGYTVFFFAEDMGMAEGLKILSVGGVTPNADTIRSGEYPFINPYYVVIGANDSENSPVRIMWNWLQSDAGQKLVSLEGYVSIR